jgi:CheY-like chemotaxis protein
MLAEAVDSLGYEARVASDGPSALEAAARFKPDAVLLDLGLPVIDGYEVADRLRTAGVSVPLIAVTGYGQETDRARSEMAGFAAHFVKPVDLDDLKHSLERLLVGRAGARV